MSVHCMPCSRLLLLLRSLLLTAALSRLPLLSLLLCVCPCMHSPAVSCVLCPAVLCLRATHSPAVSCSLPLHALLCAVLCTLAHPALLLPCCCSLLPLLPLLLLLLLCRASA